jgi:uncharacterized membrane protein
MSAGILGALTLLAALGSGLVGGVFFGFSGFVMKALARLRPAHGIAAMQSINVAAITPWFMTALFGTAAVCLAVIVAAVAAWGSSHAPYLLAGGASYLVGTIGLTLAYHVPRNEALARLDPGDAEAARHWARYLAGWTAWNHVRAAAALIASGLLVGAIHVG